MAHVTAAKVTASQGGNVRGKRRGVKVFGGGKVKPGTIIIRQLGFRYVPGDNVGVGRDYTIYSMIDGVVKFTHATGKRRGRKVVNVIPLPQSS